MAKNEKCGISDSDLCKWINKDCEKCYVASLKNEDQAKKALEDFETTLSLLPEDFDGLQGPECQFCKGEKGKAAGYMMADFAHSEPKSEVGMFFGFGKKVRRRVGSFVIASISVCRSCRKNMLVADLLKWILPVVVFAIAMAAVSVPAVASIGSLPVILIVALSILGGYLAGRLVSKAYKNAKNKKTRFDVFEIPVCAKMRERGWFLLQDNPNFLFTKRPQTGKISAMKKASRGDEGAVQTSFIND